MSCSVRTYVFLSSAVTLCYSAICFAPRVHRPGCSRTQPVGHLNFSILPFSQAPQSTPPVVPVVFACKATLVCPRVFPILKFSSFPILKFSQPKAAPVRRASGEASATGRKVSARRQETLLLCTQRTVQGQSIAASRGLRFRSQARARAPLASRVAARERSQSSRTAGLTSGLLVKWSRSEDSAPRAASSKASALACAPAPEGRLAHAGNSICSFWLHRQ